MSMTTRDAATTPTTRANAGRGFTIGGAICAVAALVILPIVFGPIGAVLGFVGYAKGDKAGLWVGIGAIVATVAGFLIAAALLSNGGGNAG